MTLLHTKTMMKNEKNIYLIRHGKVDANIDHDKLNKEGEAFANELPNRLNSSKIEFIASVESKKRCLETVSKLREIHNPNYNEYNKIDFSNLKPYKDALKYNTSVICYGAEEITEIFSIFDIEINSSNKESFYHRIIKITINENY